MKYVYHTTRALVCLLALGFVTVGIQFLLFPAQLAEPFGITAATTLGIATMRADLGGFFTVMAITLALGASNLRMANAYVLCACLLFAFAALGRLIGFIMDGVPVDGVTPFIVELAVIALLVAMANLRLRLRKAEQAQ